MQLLKDCEEQLQLSCKRETRLFYYSRGAIKGWHTRLSNTEQGRNWQKNLANCGDSPNSPKFFLRQSFLLYGRCTMYISNIMHVK